MPTYEEVLSLAKRLPLTDQVRLREALTKVSLPAIPESSTAIEVEGTDETIPAEEILESDAALQDYRAGRDAGMTPKALKQKLFGGSLG